MLAVRRAPAWGVALGFALLWLAIAPRTPDLAAQVYRVSLWATDGFQVYDGAWYAGHHLPAYSLLYPPLGALAGARFAGVLSAVAAAILFERLVRDRFGERAWPGALWFAAASVADLWIGRLTFSLGIAVGLAALLAWQRDRVWLAVLLAAGCGAASPVAGAFLGLAGAAVAVAHPGRARREGVLVGAAALAVVGALSVAFPEGGTQPFGIGSLAAVVGFSAVVAIVVREPALRAGAVLYALAALAMFAAHTPMGSNVARLGATFAGPLLLAAADRRRARPLLLGVAVLAAAWQWYAPAREVAISVGDRSMHAAYYRPLIAELDRLEAVSGPGRVEVPFTRGHWEAVHLAPQHPLARGWETQLDRKYDALFFKNRLDPGAYARWLRRTGVRWVAVPDVPLDPSGRAEARLVRGGLPYLRRRWANAHWALYEVRDATPLISGPASLTRLRRDGFDLRARGVGTSVARVRYSPYFAVAGAPACIGPAPGGWTRVTALDGGAIRVRARFDVARVVARGPRCSVLRTAG